MNTICRLKNTVQTYDWGSRTAIARLLGEGPSSAVPQAELWMGAHRKAPSLAFFRGEWVPLTDLISRYPEAILGESVLRRFGKSLPYLFKVLAAGKPLSLQAHPNSAQAKEGFDLENRKNIPLRAFHRNYRDENHKPECVCAVSPFWVLCGFRRVSEIMDLLNSLFPGELHAEKKILGSGRGRDTLKMFFQHLMTMDPSRKTEVIRRVVSRAENAPQPPAALEWIVRLHRQYPEDIGVLSPLYLNLIRLEAGEALFLPAGELHAYLGGTALELMANSDNVLRGGLTGKHVDLGALVRVLTFKERTIERLTPTFAGPSEALYPCDAKEFVLSRIRVDKATDHDSSGPSSAEILLCMEGRARIEQGEPPEALPLVQGNSVLVPAAVKTYRITGDAVCYKAAVP